MLPQGHPLIPLGFKDIRRLAEDNLQRDFKINIFFCQQFSGKIFGQNITGQKILLVKF